MNQKDYWNSVSESKNFTTTFQADAFSEYVKKDALVVDVGCGYGRTLSELEQMGYTHLIGFDFSEKMIARGKHEHPELDLRVKPGSVIDLPDDSADAVILFAVLTCIVSDAEQRELISEIHRILKPGGILYVNDFLLNTDERNLKRYEEYCDKLGVYGAFELPEGALVRHHDGKYIHDLLSDFQCLEFDNVCFTTMNGNRSNGFYFFGKKRVQACK